MEGDSSLFCYPPVHVPSSGETSISLYYPGIQVDEGSKKTLQMLSTSAELE